MYVSNIAKLVKDRLGIGESVVLLREFRLDGLNTEPADDPFGTVVVRPDNSVKYHNRVHLLLFDYNRFNINEFLDISFQEYRGLTPFTTDIYNTYSGKLAEITKDVVNNEHGGT